MERSLRFEQLIHINNGLNSIEDFDAILDKILTEARNLTNADAGTIYLNKGNKLQFSYTQNSTLFTSNLDNNNLYLNSTLPVDESSIAGYVALHKKLLNIPDVYQLTNRRPYSFDSSWEKENISIYARIVKIADVYDALVSQRVYKQAWDERDALNDLEQHSGTHFDPLLIEHFFQIYKTVQAIEKKYQD